MQARELFGQLAGACLITEHVPGRYAFHDLLRTYAAEQARALDPGTGCEPSSIGSWITTCTSPPLLTGC